MQCTPYKIVLQMHVLFELLTATVKKITSIDLSRINDSHAIHSFFEWTLFFREYICAHCFYSMPIFFLLL